MIVAYIQARGGSKRFPRKNLALWNGKPMVADAIEKAQAAGVFDYIAVSSDDPEILQIAVDYGVLPLWRSPQASSDTATDDDVAAEVTRYFPTASKFCKLYPCLPLITVKDIQDIVQFVGPFGNAYFADLKGKDAGAVYVFQHEAYKKRGTIALDKFKVWIKFCTKHACDINTPEDLKTASKMADWGNT
jgi:CMP-N-acetylneuraminic acid synthetase